MVDVLTFRDGKITVKNRLSRTVPVQPRCASIASTPAGMRMPASMALAGIDW